MWRAEAGRIIARNCCLTSSAVAPGSRSRAASATVAVSSWRFDAGWRFRIAHGGPQRNDFVLQHGDEPGDGGVQTAPPADGARMAIAVAADECDEIDVAERGRADEKRRRDVDALVAKPPDESGGRVSALGESGGDVALRFDGHELEERKGEIFELGDLAPGRARQRAERRDRRAKQPFGLLRLALDRDLTEVLGRHF